MRHENKNSDYWTVKSPPGWCWAGSCKPWQWSWSADRHSSLYIWHTWLTSSTVGTTWSSLRRNKTTWSDAEKTRGEQETERTSRRSERHRSESSTWSGYLVEVTVSHQLVLMLQCVLEKCPHDGLQFRVGGEQVGAEYLQPRVGKTVHCREGGTWRITALENTNTTVDTIILCFSCWLCELGVTVGNLHPPQNNLKLSWFCDKRK